MLHLEKILLFLLSFGSINQLTSQTCSNTLMGKVNDIHHDEGLEFATIFIEELNEGIESDGTGNFKFSNLCEGSYHFIVSHLGCQSQRMFLEIKSDTSIIIFLEHHSALLDEVIITDNKSSSNIGIQSYTISGNTLQSLAGKDLAQIVSHIPGVNILKSGSGINKPIINGLYGSRITILNQGIPQEGQQWGNDHAPEIDAFTSQKITVVKGSSAVRYGVNAMSGIVILESMPIKNDPHFHGHVLSIFNTNGRGFTTNTTFEKSAKLANFRFIITHKKSGDKTTPEYFLSNTGSKEFNIAALFSNKARGKWSRNLYLSSYNNEQGILRGSHISNLTDLKDALTRDIPLFTKTDFTYNIVVPRQKVNHHLIKIENKIQLKQNSLLSIELSQQVNRRKEYDVRRGGRDSLPSLNLDLKSFWFDTYLNIEKGNSTKTIGIQSKVIDNKNLAGTGVLPLIPNYTLFNPAFYLIFKSKIANGINTELGVRYEYQLLKAIQQKSFNVILNKEKRYNNFAGNIGLSIDKNKIISGKFNFAYTHRSPMIHELYSNGLHQSLASIEEGNENLKKEVSSKINIDIKVKPIHDGQLSVSTYYHIINDFIYLAPTGENRITIRGAFPVFKYKQADVTLKGIDIMYNLSINHHFEITGKLSALKSINRLTKKGLIYMPPLNGGLELSYIADKILFLNDSKFSFLYSYTAKQNNIDLNEDFVDSPAAYKLIDMSYSFKQSISKYQVICSIKVENILNEKYRDYLNRMHYFADELGRNVSMKVQIIF